MILEIDPTVIRVIHPDMKKICILFSFVAMGFAQAEGSVSAKTTEVPVKKSTAKKTAEKDRMSPYDRSGVKVIPSSEVARYNSVGDALRRNPSIFVRRR